MPTVLYNKYRSSDFDQLIGQEHVVKVLKNAIKNNKISHAYLFVGSRGTGKTSTARILTKALNCTDLKKDGNPCSKCSNCISISQGRFLDLIEIDAASNRGIDQIRELKEKIEFSPVEGKYKIYIIDEVHMLTKEAFNALLKTLEEPPDHVIFILATTDVHKLPPTILSRCQRYDFKLGNGKEVRGMLEGVAKDEKIKLSKEALDILVENAHGSFRDALSLLDVVVSGQMYSKKPSEVSESEVRQILGIPDTTMVYHLLDNLLQCNNKEALELIEELEEKGVNFAQFLKYILSMLQDILVKKLSGKFNDSEYSFASDLSASQITQLIGIFLNAERNIRYSTIPALVLEMCIPAVNELCGCEPETVSEKELEKKEEGEEVEEEEEEEEVSNQSVSDLNLEEVSKNWNKIIEKIKPSNGHLFAFLGSSKLISLDSGVLTVEVPYEFHKERIESSNSREAINNVFKDVLGCGLKIECVVNGNSKKAKKVSADVILQNVPSKEYTAKKTGGGSKKIEEIFAGM